VAHQKHRPGPSKRFNPRARQLIRRIWMMRNEFQDLTQKELADTLNVSMFTLTRVLNYQYDNKG